MLNAVSISFQILIRAKLTYHETDILPYLDGNGLIQYSDYFYDDYGGNLEPFENIADGSTIFVKSDFIRAFFKKKFHRLNAKIILITHNGDYFPNKNYKKYLTNDNIITWFAQNPSFTHPKLIQLPIGLENTNYYSDKNENLKQIIQLRNIPWRKRKILLYINFNYKTNSQSRKSLIDRFKKFKDSLVIETKLNYKTYLNHLRNSKYVLCPRGNTE